MIVEVLINGARGGLLPSAGAIGVSTITTTHARYSGVTYDPDFFFTNAVQTLVKSD